MEAIPRIPKKDKFQRPNPEVVSIRTQAWGKKKGILGENDNPFYSIKASIFFIDNR
jgi:hypothetical protein